MSYYKYIIILLSKIINYVSAIYVNKNVCQILIEQNMIPVYDVYSTVNSPDQRIKLIDHGIECAKKCLVID